MNQKIAIHCSGVDLYRVSIRLILLIWNKKGENYTLEIVEILGSPNFENWLNDWETKHYMTIQMSSIL